MKPKRTPFPWVTNINESSIDKLKKKITVTWADIENVNEATLAIFVGMKKAIITDDSDLQKTLKVMATAGTQVLTFPSRCVRILDKGIVSL